jgi:hypothetical protein
VGMTSNPPLVVMGFTLFAAYTRVRLIIFQSKLLADLKHSYKATLLSSLNLFTLFGDLLAISILAHLISGNGYSNGHLWFGLIVFALGFAMWLAMVAESKLRHQKAI